MICCPTCRRSFSEAVDLDLLPAFILKGKHRKIALNTLIAHYPGSVNVNDLVEAMYGDDPDGGPEWVAVIARKYVHELRKTLLEYGWRIPFDLKGRALTAYRLEKIPTRKP